MDYRLYHHINELVEHHPWLGTTSATVEGWSIPFFALATVALWLAAPTDRERKWKLASVTALVSSVLALLGNLTIAHVWSRARPFVPHPDASVFLPRSHDSSFPSDHASAAFAIAVAVLAFDRMVGSVLLFAAALVSVGRVVTGVHYPADVLAGALVGASAALLVVRFGRRPIAGIVRAVERVTDPILAVAARRSAR